MTAPEPIRTEYRDLPTGQLVAKLTGSRARAGDDDVTARTRSALKRLATRYQQLDEEITSYDTDLADLVNVTNPAMVQTREIQAITAAQLLITAGDNPDRIHCRSSLRDALRRSARPRLLRQDQPVPPQPRR